MVRRQFRLISTLIYTVVAITFLVVGIFAQTNLLRQAEISGVLTFKAESISADIYIYHGLSKNNSYSNIYDRYDKDLSRATSTTSGPDLRYVFGEANQTAERSLDLNAAALKMSDSLSSYSYYVVVRNTFTQENGTAILADFENLVTSNSVYTVEQRIDYSPDYTIYNKVENKIYIAPQTEVVFVVSVEVNPQLVTARVASAPISAMLSLTQYKGVVPTERATAGLTYTAVSGGYSVSGGSIAGQTEIFIPRTYNSQPVVAISANAFENSTFSKVYFPNTLTTIQANAFKENKNLVKVWFPNSLTSIGASAFSSVSASKLKNIKLNEGLISVGSGAFYNAVSTKLEIPSTLTTISNYGFSGINTLEKVTVAEGNTAFYIENDFLIGNLAYTGTKKAAHAYFGSTEAVVVPDGITMLTNYLFSGRTKINSITLPEGLLVIGTRAFYDVPLLSVNLPNSLTEIGASVFSGNYLKNIVVPEGVTSIGSYAFSNSKALESIEIPSTVTTITAVMLANSPNLSSVTFNGVLNNYEAGFMNNVASNVNVYVPQESLQAFISAHATKSFSNRTLNFIGVNQNLNYTYNATYDGYNITGFKGAVTSTILNIPEILNGPQGPKPVVSIGTDAFKDKGLTEVTLPNTIKIIEVGAFDSTFGGASANSFNSLTLPNQLEIIEDNAFRNSFLGEELVIPDSVKTIGNNAFRVGTTEVYLTGLKYLTLGKGLEIIRGSAFFSAPIVNLELPEGLKEIESYVFYNQQTKSITLPASLEKIGIHSIRNGVTSYTTEEVIIKGTNFIQNHLNIGATAPFLTNLKQTLKIYVSPENETQIRDANTTRALSNASSHTIIARTEALQYSYTANDGGYYVVTGFKEGESAPNNIVVPNIYNDITNGEKPVKEIGSSAFKDSFFSKITLPSSLNTIRGSSFEANKFLTEIDIPEGVTLIGGSAFNNSHIKKVTLPSTLKTLSDYAFSNTNYLNSIKLPIGLETIGTGAFWGSRLNHIEIPHTVKSIGTKAFFNNGLLIKSVIFQSAKIFEAGGVYGTEIFHNNHADISFYVPTNSLTNFTNIKATLTNQATAQIIGATTNLSYTYNNSLGGYTVNGYIPGSQLNASLIIPTHYNDGINGLKEVVEVGHQAFYRYKAGVVVNTTSVSMPDTIKVIGQSAFESNSLTSVKLPANLTTISKWAFFDTTLTEIFIPEGVKTIGPSAFQNNNSLKYVSIAKSVTSIGDNAFTMSSSKLEVVVLNSPKVLYGYGTGILNGTTTDIYVPQEDYLSFKNRHAVLPFSNLAVKIVPISMDLKFEYEPTWLSYSLKGFEDGLNYNTDLKIPAMYSDGINGFKVIQVVEARAFENKGLTSVVLSDKLTNIKDHAFRNNNIKELIIPDSVVDIGQYSFTDNFQLEYIEFGKNVKHLRSGAFRLVNDRASKLRNVTFNGSQFLETGGTFGTDVFGMYTKPLLTIYVPQEKLSLFISSHNSNVFLTGQTPVEFVPYIDNLNFTYNNNLNGYTVTGFKTGQFNENVDIPGFYNDGINGIKPVVEIGYRAFYNLSQKVLSVNIPATVKQIGYGAFQNLSANRGKINKVTFADGLVEIGDYAFQYNEIEEVKIPNSVTTIGTYAFHVNNIKEILISSNLTEIKEGVFRANLITNVVIPEGVAVIGTGAFYGVQAKTLILPSTMSEIGESAFASNRLSSVTIPSGVSKIGKEAFKGNATLNNVVFEGIVVVMGGSYGAGVFDGSATVLNISVPTFAVGYFTTSHLSNVFSNVPTVNINTSTQGLTYTYLTATKSYRVDGFIAGQETTNLVIPSYHNDGVNGVNPVTEIGNSAFDSKGLTSVILPNTITKLGGNALSRNSLTSITLPQSLKEIGAQALFNNRLETVLIPKSVTTIGGASFANNKLSGNLSLTNLKVEAGNTSFKVDDNMLLSMNGTIVYGYFGNKIHIEIPVGVQTIHSFAFVGLPIVSVSLPNTLVSLVGGAFEGTKIQTITVPASVKSISQYAFGSISTLKEIVFEGNGFLPQNGGSYGIFLQGVSSAVSIYAHEEMLTSLQNAHASSGFFSSGSTATITWGTITKNLVYTYVSALGGYSVEGFVGEKTFDNPTNLVLPTYYNDGTNGEKPIVSIGVRAFKVGNESNAKLKNYLTGLILPSRLIEIKSEAFMYNNTMLSSSVKYPTFALPATLEKIETLGLYNNGFWGTLYIPKGMQNIGTGGFYAHVNSVSVEAGNENLIFDGNILIDVNLQKVILALGSSIISKNIVIPEGIKIIGGYLFMGRSIQTVSLPNSIITIEQYAFQNNKLTSIALPSSLQTIMAYAFNANQIAGSLALPNSLINLYNNAFSNNKLTSLTVSNSLKTISNNAFQANLIETINWGTGIETIQYNAFLNNKLTTLNIPNTVKTIGYDAFTTNNLTSVSLPASITSLTVSVFTNNPNLNSINILGGSYLKVVNDILIAGNLAVNYFGKATSVAVPEGVATIGANAFNGRGLISIQLPESLTAIQHNSFTGNNLTSIVIPANVQTIQGGILENNPNFETLVFEGSKMIESGGMYGEASGSRIYMISSAKANKVTIHVPLSKLSAFQTAQATKSFANANIAVTLATGATNLVYEYSAENGGYMVSDFTGNLPSHLVIPQSYNGANGTLPVVGIKTDALNIHATGKTSRGSITNLMLPNTFKIIENVAFRGSPIKVLNLPKSLTQIKYIAFYGNLIEGVHIPVNLTTIDTNVFASPSQRLLTSITVDKDNVNFEIVNDHFLVDKKDVNNKTIVSYFGPAGQTVTIPSGIKKITDFAFMSRKVSNIIFNAEITIIQSYAFYDNSFTSIVYPSGITMLTYASLNNNASLTQIDLPATINNIQASSLSGLSNLSSLIVRATVPPSINKDGFGSVTNASNFIVYVPSSSVDAYKNSQAWRDALGENYASRIVAIS